MAESFFDKLKKTVIEGAATAASKAESATRLGKLHLDKMSEERKLQDKEAILGRFIYKQSLQGQLENLSERPEFLEKLGGIRLSHEAIAKIQTAINEESAKAKESENVPEESGSDNSSSQSTPSEGGNSKELNGEAQTNEPQKEA